MASHAPRPSPEAILTGGWIFRLEHIAKDGEKAEPKQGGEQYPKGEEYKDEHSPKGYHLEDAERYRHKHKDCAHNENAHANFL